MNETETKSIPFSNLLLVQVFERTTNKPRANAAGPNSIWCTHENHSPKSLMHLKRVHFCFHCRNEWQRMKYNKFRALGIDLCCACTLTLTKIHRHTISRVKSVSIVAFVHRSVLRFVFIRYGIENENLTVFLTMILFTLLYGTNNSEIWFDDVPAIWAFHGIHWTVRSHFRRKFVTNKHRKSIEENAMQRNW